MVGTVVGVGGRGVEVSVPGTVVGAGWSGVGEAGSSAGVGTPHAEKAIVNEIHKKILIRADAALINNLYPDARSGLSSQNNVHLL